MLEDSAHRQESIAETVKQLNAGTLSPWSVSYMELTHCRLENIRFLVLGLRMRELVDLVLEAIQANYEDEVERHNAVACVEMCNGDIVGCWHTMEKDCKALKSKAYKMIEQREMREQGMMATMALVRAEQKGKEDSEKSNNFVFGAGSQPKIFVN